MKRDENNLAIYWPEFSEALQKQGLTNVPEVGTHPHHVKTFLIEQKLFPAKWLNRVFSVGGIKWDAQLLMIQTYKHVDIMKDEVYVSARQIGAKLANIIYEDDHCLVAFKPVGMSVHGSFKGEINTLDVAVAKYMLENEDPIEIRHIHRLDDDTSGPVLYAKHDLAQQRLDEAMRNKEIERLYIAIVEGVMLKDKGTINAPIGKNRHNSKARMVSPSGEHAITHFEVLRRFDRYTEVKFELETGRTHQIRVHSSYIGHPIAGDGLYGATTELRKTQALHGQFLLFPHPISNEQIKVEAPLPRWFVQLVEQIEKS